MERVALTDGSAPLQAQVRTQFPEHTLVLDLVHALEYLWDASNALLGETSRERTNWVKERTLKILRNETLSLITELQMLSLSPSLNAVARKTLQSVAGYYERNLPYRDYANALRQGWPIGTGVIEGACRHLVKDRCELSGMRWTREGAEAILQVRSLLLNGDWELFCHYRKQQRALQHYGTGFNHTAGNPVMMVA